MGVIYSKELKNINVYNGLKNCIFYLQQNFLILLFILIKQNSKEQELDNKYIHQCNELLEENSIWLNYKADITSIFISNNNIVNNTLINIVE